MLLKTFWWVLFRLVENVEIQVNLGYMEELHLRWTGSKTTQIKDILAKNKFSNQRYTDSNGYKLF